MKKFHSLIATSLSISFVAGCAVGPEYQKPEMTLPLSWQIPDSTAGSNITTTAGERWWLLYQDKLLAKLIDEALLNNLDNELAAARVLEARALAGIAQTDLAPTLVANAGINRNKNSQVGVQPLQAGTPRIQNSYRTTVQASYELDFWGRYRYARDAARAELLAAESTQQAVRLALTAQVAQQYFSLLAADSRERVLRQTVEGRRESLDLFRKQLAAGVTSEFFVLQAQAEHAAVRAQLATAVQGREQQEASLAVMLGRSPREILDSQLARGQGIVISTQTLWVPAGLPSDLLLRRPDLREAEQRLIAANARIGNIRAQIFPAISLTAFLGSESADLADLFSGPAGVFQFAAAAAQPLFNAGRTDYALAAANARRDQALVTYKQAVANAFNDVRQALSSQQGARQTLIAETERTEALQGAYGKVIRRLEGGIANRLEVLDTERQLLQAQLAQIDAELGQRIAVANIFKALGGGWLANEPGQK